ncbi:HpcH/HpaI aldolase/citrate lyase family protein [Arthrobacter cryoconiti]|uniref:HpcH/HpaI aldolase/citrate lyase family protein n=1 Tax=Arthrobacter cryoconiti TaxID=748907 RepID=A0ABV8R3D0_9MICC|nr:CoA ester lyase [Arthrobacter cryoconiti]MCC9067193.1 CoA ester lyase [Arthrobacter cryoconiti]
MGPALLFAPADRPERYLKAAERSDAVILDLEDAVAPDAKAQAREHLVANPLDPATTMVRVNALSTAESTLDLAALARTRYRTIMVAKAEDPGAIAALADYNVVALCETAAGIMAAAELAKLPNVVALMWGAEDLVASLGGTSSRFADGSYRAIATHARSLMLLAAGAGGKTAIDSIYADIPDLPGLAEESEDAVASGFGAKACIHPSQVAVIRESYRPSDVDVAAATQLLAAASAAGTGVFAYQGKMVDGPILKHAQETLRRAGV